MTTLSWILLFFFVCFAGIAFMFYASLRTQTSALAAIREGQQSLYIALERLERVVTRLDADLAKAQEGTAQNPVLAPSEPATPPNILEKLPTPSLDRLSPEPANPKSDADEDWPDGPPPSNRRMVPGKSPMPEPWRDPIKSPAPAELPLNRTLERLSERPLDPTRDRVKHLELSTLEAGERGALPTLKL